MKYWHEKLNEILKTNKNQIGKNMLTFITDNKIWFRFMLESERDFCIQKQHRETCDFAVTIMFDIFILCKCRLCIGTNCPTEEEESTLFAFLSVRLTWRRNTVQRCTFDLVILRGDNPTWPFRTLEGI